LKKVKKVPVEKQDVLETHAAMFNPTELLADEQLRWWHTDAKRPEQKKEPVRVRITTVPIYRPKPKNEDNLRQGQKAAYTASRVETIQLRKADVHQDHIRPQLLSLRHRTLGCARAGLISALPCKMTIRLGAPIFLVPLELRRALLLLAALFILLITLAP
jgi:hypothetical protein